MKEYVVGFLFSEDSKQVILIEKNKPDWQKGYLNGIGGKIEENETPLMAMIREFDEETGVNIQQWKEFLTLKTDNCIVYFFLTFSNKLSEVQTITTEKVGIYEVSDINTYQTISNLKWLIPMCLDEQHLYGVFSTKHDM